MQSWIYYGPMGQLPDDYTEMLHEASGQRYAPCFTEERTDGLWDVYELPSNDSVYVGGAYRTRLHAISAVVLRKWEEDNARTREQAQAFPLCIAALVQAKEAFRILKRSGQLPATIELPVLSMIDNALKAAKSPVDKTKGVA
jgi:hypothetical protein